MTVVVSFVTPRAMGSISSQLAGTCRVRENITIPGTTSASVQDGEIVLIGNGESSMVAVAFGTTPDAAAAASTVATTAGMPVPAGAVMPAKPNIGDKINIKAVV